MKKFTALALVAGLAASGAQAQPYDLTYDASTGELSATIYGNIINYTLESTDDIFLEDEALTATNHQRFVSFFYLSGSPVAPNGTASSTPRVLGESNQSYNGPQSGTFSLGMVLPAGLTESEFQAVADKEATYVTGLGSAKQNWNLVYVPEPTSLALLGLGGLLVARRRRSA